VSATSSCNQSTICIRGGAGDDPLIPFLDDIKKKYGHQPTFLQAVEEMALSLKPLFDDPELGEFYRKVFLIMSEPERTCHRFFFVWRYRLAFVCPFFISKF